MYITRYFLQYPPDKNKKEGAQEKLSEINNGITSLLVHLFFLTFSSLFSVPFLRYYASHLICFNCLNMKKQLSRHFYITFNVVLKLNIT